MISVTAAGILRPLLPLVSALAVVSAAQAGIDPDLTEGDAAGRVRLTDGSVIVGTVSEIRDGTVVVENTFNDDALKIPVALVASFERAQSTDLMINEDQIITLASVQVVDGNIQLPEGELALSDVYIMNPEDWEEGRGFNWSGDTSAALAVARGNTDTNEIDVAVNTVIETIRDRYTFNGRIDKDDTGNNDGERVDTEDKWKVLGKYDYFLANDRNYLGVNLGLESDALADIDLRAYAGPYFGRKLLARDRISLDGELGLVYVSTDYSDIQFEDDDCATLAATELQLERARCGPGYDKKEYGAVNWNLTGESNILGGDSRLYLRHVGIVGFDLGDEILIKTTAGLAFPLVFGFQAAAEISFDYDASLEQEIDQKYSFRVGYAW